MKVGAIYPKTKRTSRLHTQSDESDIEEVG